MVLWWIGNVILLVAMLPVVIFLLNRVLAALERIRAASDNILAGGGALVGELNACPKRSPRPTRRSAPCRSVRSGTRARSRSCSAKRRGTGRKSTMPGAAWVTLIIAALIIAITAVALLRVIFHLRAISRHAGAGHRRRAAPSRT